MIRREDLEGDSTWRRSMGEKFWLPNFRKGRYHAVCTCSTGYCSIHQDKHDPYESLTSLIQHLLDNKLIRGLIVGGIAGVAADQILNDGKVTRAISRKVLKWLFG